MTFNCVKLWRAVTIMKHLASVVSLIFLAKTSIWNKITFPASNSRNSQKNTCTRVSFLIELQVSSLNSGTGTFV